jgi:hypothetical protein
MMKRLVCHGHETKTSRPKGQPLMLGVVVLVEAHDFGCLLDFLLKRYVNVVHFEMI